MSASRSPAARLASPRRPRATALAWALALVGLACTAPLAEPARAEGEAPRVIRVSGEATAGASPDRVLVDLAVVTQRDRAADTVAENAEQLARVFGAVRKVIGKTGRIETTSYSLSPRYRYDKADSRQVLEGYTARNAVRVTLDDLDRVGRVLDEAAAAGANEVQQLAFVLQDDTPQRDAALRAASERALAKARTIASALGLEIARVASVDEVVRHGAPPMLEMRAARAMADTPIAAPGSVDVHAQVNLTVEIR